MKVRLQNVEGLGNDIKLEIRRVNEEFKAVKEQLSEICVFSNIQEMKN